MTGDKHCVNARDFINSNFEMLHTLKGLIDQVSWSSELLAWLSPRHWAFHEALHTVVSPE